MSDWTVAELAEQFKAGHISRRHFIAKMFAAGLTMPVIASVLAACGSSNNGKSAAKTGAGAATQAASAATQAAGGGSAAANAATAAASAAANAFTPTKRGGGGTLKLLWWQGPTLPQPHINNGTKDFDASRIFYEPLAEFDADANLVPVLAAEIPTVENGAVAKDGTSVTWKLKQGVTWHDGQPFTADDVAFTYQFIADPATAANTAGQYVTVKSVEAVDPQTVKVTFKSPVPYWQTAFVGANGMIIPKHIFGPYIGKESHNAPNNLKPLGTGPYKYVDFRPGDSLEADINPNYHVANRPFFDHISLKGGGDAPSAARAVLQTGDYDYAWNMQVTYDELQGIQKGGTGQIVIFPGSGAESMYFNFTDPNKEVGGEASSLQTKHPFFADVKVRQAFNLMFDRKTVVDQLYGKEGQIVNYLVYNPSKFAPTQQTQLTFDPAKAGQMLDDAGWKKGSDGVRANNGVKMKIVYATSINSLRQNEQAIIKKTLESQGIQVELKSVDANIFFGDATNPDNLAQMHFDLGMWTNSPGIDPQNYFRAFVSQTHGQPNDNIAQKSNNWSGTNVMRYINPAFDQIWEQAATELDAIKRADLFKKMNEMIAADAPKLPLAARNGVSVAKGNLQGMDLQPWASSDLWRLAYWYRKT
ncbi:MAG TPA: peptide ABC transporter substrate-binding protein [Dehalococcoidia bacterium]|nr:peptide ABC transporter substrate-binding protein [Dehalococcoidia bacterium]